jgi:cation:H+ antiporter
MWLHFFGSAILIIFAGMQLTRNAEKISNALNMSTAWAGALLLPLATSLPELVVSRRAVIIDSPDLAGGNIYGSILFNLVLIALIDLLQGAGPLTARRKRGLIVSALLCVVIISFSCLAILISLPYRIGWIGIDSLLILLIFLLGSSAIVRLEKKPARSENESYPKNELAGAILRFSLAALVIIFAGSVLTDAADAIARETGLSHTLVGSIFVAVSTSLPELVTITTAVRLGLVEMAVANVFGANFFNILLLFFADIFYRRGLLLSSLSPDILIVALMGIILTAVALLGFIFPLRRHYFRLGVTSILIIGGYLLTLVFLLYL